METIEKIISLVFNVIIFTLISIVFLPALLIVNTLQNIWSDKLKDLFKY